jgi:hypothetical protein
MKGPDQTYRPLSASTRLWLASDRVCPPCVNQPMYEGTGTFDLKNWKEAVRIASEANRGSRIVLRGMFGSGRWVDSGITPTVREVDGSRWDGMCSEGAPYLQSSFPVRTGPNCEVVLIQGNPARVAFRSHHAIMDGRGTMTWAEDIFRVLRGEKPLGAEFIMTENDLLNVQWGKRKKTLPHTYIPLTGKTEGSDTGPVWKRRTIMGKHPQLLARVMLLTAREARRHREGNVRIGIPVDLRYRREGLRSTSNLANAIYIDIDIDATVEQLATEIEKRVTNLYDGEITWEDKIARHIPIWLGEKGIRMEGSRNQKSGHYRFSGFISNLGRVDVEKFSSEDFKAHTFYAVPLIAPMVPFMMTLSGAKDRSELMINTPKNMATGGRLEAAINNIVNGLNSTI